MAYTKTTWVNDDVPAINATNLNKIEQGIFDAAATADAASPTATTTEKTSSTGSAIVPAGTEAQRDGAPAAGYFRFNTDVPGFEGYDGTQWGPVGGGATGAGPDRVFHENDQVVSESYTITAGKNAISAGPITVGVAAVAISNIDGDATTITVTTSAAHGLVVGDNTDITGTTNYNGTFAVDTVIDATNFTIASVSHDFAAEVTGFSQKEVIVTIPDGSVWVIA